MGGLTPAELNALELEFLLAIDFRLAVSPQDLTHLADLLYGADPTPAAASRCDSTPNLAYAAPMAREPATPRSSSALAAAPPPPWPVVKLTPPPSVAAAACRLPDCGSPAPPGPASPWQSPEVGPSDAGKVVIGVI
jgi:hypothetical protein